MGKSDGCSGNGERPRNILVFNTQISGYRRTSEIKQQPCAGIEIVRGEARPDGGTSGEIGLDRRVERQHVGGCRGERAAQGDSGKSLGYGTRC